MLTLCQHNGATYYAQNYAGIIGASLICGLKSATSNYPYIWCKCPKLQRWDMSQEWSLLDTKKGVRTI